MIFVNDDALKQTLVNVTCRLLRPGQGDVAFINGASQGLPDDIFIWYNRDEQHMMWFNVTQAKSYFGPTYEERFGPVERLPWGTWGTGVKQAVSNG